MSILMFILLFVVVGLGLWAINKFVPMQANIKTVLNVAMTIIMVIVAIVFLISLLGLNTSVLTTPHPLR